MPKALRMAVCVLVAGLLAAPVLAAAAKTYQVTGPVLELTSDMIVVQKGAKERWEIARDATTKVTGDLKVGAKVTIEYRMSATSIEVKPAATTKSATKKK
jgi:cytochrome c1